MRSKAFTKWVLVLLCVCVFAAAAESAQVIYVDDDAPGGGEGSSWTDACKYVQDALAIAATAAKPVEIRVAQGLYKPDQGAGVTPGNQAASFQLLNGVTVKGGYAGIAAPDPNARNVSLYETILSGDLDDDDNNENGSWSDDSCNVVTAGLTDSTAVMDGMVIVANEWTSTACWFRPGRGATVFIDAGSPTIRNCRFNGSPDLGSDEMVSLRNSSAPVFTDCVFTDCNYAMQSVSSSPTLVNCLFVGNQWDKAVSCGGNGAVSLTGCRFESSGMGVVISGPIDLTLMECTFLGNRTALSACGGAANASNCIFESNRVGVDAVSGDLLLAGCKFSGHTGGAVNGTADFALIGCSIADNFGGLAPLMMSGNTVMVSDCTFTGNSGLSAGGILGGRFVTLRNCEFSGNVGGRAGAVSAGGDVFRAANCLFTGNSGERTGALQSDAAVFSLSNCTFADNRGQVNAIRYEKPGPASPAEMVQCIVWDGPQAVLEKYPDRGLLAVTYCDVQGGHEGAGNLDADPCFVAPGYWADPNDPSIVLGPEDVNAVWVQGDYHLKSQAGHWDRAIEGWVFDEVTSPCIDAGDPNGFIAEEPFPNGGFVNMGAYGGTVEASRTYFGGPVCENQLAGDINGDCVVDQTDMDILTSHWLMQSWPTSNEPPTVVIVEPNDGDEFREAAPITIRAEAFDPDGSVIKVVFSMEYIDETGGIGMGGVDADPSDGWKYEWPRPGWASAGSKQVWTLRAEAMDDHGNLAVSPEVKVTLNLAN